LFWFFVFVRCIWLSRLCAVYLFFRLCAVFFVSGWRSRFDQVQIQSMSTLVSSTLQIRRHGYSGHFNIVIFVGICNLPFYAINMDAVSLFADSSFLFLAIMNLYYIDVLFLFEWMNIICFVKKKKNIETCHNCWNEN
jgi:hypothetical protein